MQGARIKGHFTALQRSGFVAVRARGTTQSQGQGSLCFAWESHFLSFISSYSSTHDGSQSSPTHRARKRDQSWSQMWAPMRTNPQHGRSLIKVIYTGVCLQKKEKYLRSWAKWKTSAYIRTDNKHVNHCEEEAIDYKLLKQTVGFVVTGDFIKDSD